MIGSLYFLFMLSSNHGFRDNVQPKDVSATSGRQTSTLNGAFDFCSNYTSKMHHFGAMGMEQIGGHHLCLILSLWWQRA